MRLASLIADRRRAPRRPPSRRKRRELLRSLVAGAAVIGASLLGFAPLAALSGRRLRPPGALPEQDFLASCIKCGQCVQVCPVEAIRLADLDDGFGVGTPYITPRSQACDFSCDALQCVLACPTGSLSHRINYPREVRIGLARLAGPQRCLARRGEGFRGPARGTDFPGRMRYLEVDRWNPIPIRDHPYEVEICDLCVRECPIEIQIRQCEAGSAPSNNPDQCPPRHALTLAPLPGPEGGRRMTPAVGEGCVGCGVCEMICPAAPAAIVVDAGRSWGAA